MSIYYICRDYKAVSTQKGTLYDIYSKFKCNGNISHININDYEGTCRGCIKFYCAKR